MLCWRGPQPAEARWSVGVVGALLCFNSPAVDVCTVAPATIGIQTNPNQSSCRQVADHAFWLVPPAVSHTTISYLCVMTNQCGQRVDG